LTMEEETMTDFYTDDPQTRATRMSFYDLPKATRDELWQRIKAGELQELDPWPFDLDHP